jgi:putative ABC transport system permease protein
MWALAFKNVCRDRRRAGATVLAFAVGVLGLVLFLDYVRFIEATLSAVVVYQQSNGHVEIYRRGGLASLASEPSRFSIPWADYRRIHEAALSLPGAVLVTPQMEGVGTIQYGERTTVFLATGVVPEDDRRLRADGEKRLGVRIGQSQGGGTLNGPQDALMTRQLADILQMPRGAGADARVQLSGLAFDRRLNAEDALVAGEFSTGIEETESKSIKLPLSLMQRLYRTGTVSRVVVLLDDRARSAGYARGLREKLRDLPGYEVYTWNDPRVGKIYDSFISFFGAVFTFTGITILAICLLTVQSTISLSVLDRMREIGAMRSMGFGRVRLARLLAREGVLLSAIGGTLGVAFASVTAAALSRLHVTTTLPRMSLPVPVQIQPDVPFTAGTVIVCGLLAASSSYLIAKRRIPAAVLDCFHTGVVWVVAAAALTVMAPPRVLGARPLGAGALAGGPSQDELVEWVRASDRARGGYGAFTWDLRIESRDGSDRSDSSYRVDVKGDKALAYILSPPTSKGETILIHGHAMWFMKPGLRRPVSVSPRQRLTGEAANGDIASIQYADNYRTTLLDESTFNGRPVYRLRLEALRKDVTYDQVIYDVDATTHLALKAEFLTPDGMALKEAIMAYDNRVTRNGQMVLISSMAITDSKYRDRSSVLTYSNVRWVEHPDSRFTLAGLGE